MQAQMAMDIRHSVENVFMRENHRCMEAKQNLKVEKTAFRVHCMFQSENYGTKLGRSVLVFIGLGILEMLLGVC